MLCYFPKIDIDINEVCKFDKLNPVKSKKFGLATS